MHDIEYKGKRDISSERYLFWDLFLIKLYSFYFIYLYIYLSIYLFIYLSICLDVEIHIYI